MGISLLTFLALAGEVALTACGDNVAPCGIEYVRDGNCYAAQLFASRDSVGIVPDAADVESYAERWKRATLAEPLLDSRFPQTYRDTPPSSIELATTNQAAITAWKQQVVVTGDPSIDDVITQLRPTHIETFNSNPDGAGVRWLFTFEVPVTYNEENLFSALSATGTTLPDAQHVQRDDGRWTWLGATAQIDFDVGFYDCFLGCGAFRHLRAIVPPAGTATVYDLGGDPLPDGVTLSPNTIPP